MIKAVVFDMDGLMFDTEKLFLQCGIESAKKIGYKITEKLIMKCIGTNYKNIKKTFLEELGTDFPFELFYSEYRKLKDKIIAEQGIDIKIGLKELIEYLLKNNYLLAIASSSNMNIIKFYLKMANIDENIFNIIISGSDFEKGKPAPDIYLKTCELLRVNPKETLVLEDSNHGIKAAYLAKCQTALIPDIVTLTEETLNISNHIFLTLLDVIKYLETLPKK